MDFISLFSGIGGFDLGLERAGMTCVAQVEIDKAARGVLATHWPNVERIEDVTKAGKHNLPAASLICGGSPCQDVSMAGTRAGLDGERSGLFFEFVRILEELKPEWFSFENVDGLLTSNSGRDFATVLFCLVRCGYRCAWRVLDAQHFGLPQRRARVFIVGHRRNGSAAQVLFESESAYGDFAQSGAAGNSVSASIGSGNVRTDGKFFTDRIMACDARGRAVGSISPTLVGSHLDRITDYTPIIFTEDGVRRLTPLECERLQGFPDGWTSYSNMKTQTDKQRYDQLGNAVSVPVIEWIGKRIMAVTFR